MIYARLWLGWISDCGLSCLMNKRSKPDAEVKQQHTLVEFKAGCDSCRCDSFIRLSNLRIDGIFEIQLIFKESIPLPRGRNCTYACVGHTLACNVHSHAECLRRHARSECSASTSDRRRRPGSAPGPSATALRRVGSVPRRPAPPRSRFVRAALIHRSTVASLQVTGTRVRHNMAGGAPARSTLQ
jgi:hypothetical protein